MNYNKMPKKELISLLENTIAYTKNRICNDDDVYKLLHPWCHKRQEHFLVITLNGEHKPIHIHEISKGIINRTIVHPREVFRVAIQDYAVSIIIAHNHPSGNLEVSREDKDLTKRLKDAGTLLGIPVLDHIIFSHTGRNSMLEQGEF